MNDEGKPKLPKDAPLGFIPKKLRPLVRQEGELNKRAWECALLLAIRDEIRAGNIYVQDSKRFGRFNNFFIADNKWRAQREDFFKRAGLPADAADVPDYLSERLNGAFDRFLEGLPENSYASVDEEGGQLSVDSATQLDEAGEEPLEALQDWLSEGLRDVKLPELLIEVDSELALDEHYTDTHGYTEINFAAFAMLGRRFAPRIRGLKSH